MSSSDVIRRVADRQAKRLVDPLVRALSRGVVDIEALTSAFEHGDRARAVRIALESVDPQHLRVLVAQVNMQERLLDVMEDAGDSLRCEVRPTVERAISARDSLGPVDQQTQLQTELAVQRVESNLRPPLSPIGAPAAPATPIPATEVWPVLESPSEMEQRLRRGYTEIVRIDAKQFAAEYERSQGTQLAHIPRRTERLRDVAELDAYPQVTATTREGLTIVDVVDGRHRLGLAAERNLLIDVAMTPESRAVFPLAQTGSAVPRRRRRPWGLRAAVSAEHELTDVVVTIGTQQHGINVTVFTTQTSHRISVPHRLRRRLLRWSRDANVVLHSVAFDMRGHGLYSGHGYYYSRGIKSMSLTDMTRVRDASHLRELVRGDA
jgi:hypothetical protein